jgi:hypothetical protein
MKASLLTAAQVAVMLCVSVATVRRHARELGGVQPPGFRKWLFEQKRVESLLWE